MDFMSWLVSLGIFPVRETYKKGKINAITRKSEQAQAKIDAWRAKYTDQVLEEQYQAEWVELYKPTDGLNSASIRENRRRYIACMERIMYEIPEVLECENKNWEPDFVRLMLAKHGKVLTQDVKFGVYAYHSGHGEGDAKYKNRWEQNHYMQWYDKYLAAHGGPTGMKFFPNASLVRISKTDKTEPPMKDYYELNETDPLLFTLGHFDWLENKSQYQSGYWK